MEGIRRHLARYLLVALVLASIIPSAGCIVGLPAQIGYMIWGLKRPAEFGELKNSRVALVVYSKHDSFSARGRQVRLLTDKVHYELGNNVKKIHMVPKSEVSGWIDSHTMTEKELLQVGRGVSADQLVAVKIHDWDIREGQTLYRGHIIFTVTVYDMREDGKQVWTTGRRTIKYPKHSSVPTIETNEVAFESAFFNEVGQHISQLFFDIDLAEEYANEDVVVE